jgi:hypothetical protein
MRRPLPFRFRKVEAGGHILMPGPLIPAVVRWDEGRGCGARVRVRSVARAPRVGPRCRRGHQSSPVELPARAGDSHRLRRYREPSDTPIMVKRLLRNAKLIAETLERTRLGLIELESHRTRTYRRSGGKQQKPRKPMRRYLRIFSNSGTAFAILFL